MNYENYNTPPWCFEKLDKIIDFTRFKAAVEPCAGDRRIVYWLKKKGITVFDFDLQRNCNWLKLESPPNKIPLIITNPPYSKAFSFVKKSLKEADTVIMLLRLGFLASQIRHKFWIENPLSGLIVLSKCPSFKYGRTDNSDYAWFIWDRTKIGQFITHYPL